MAMTSPSLGCERDCRHATDILRSSGAGPGDLISIRGRQWLEIADLILCAEASSPRALTLCAKPSARDST